VTTQSAALSGHTGALEAFLANTHPLASLESLCGPLMTEADRAPAVVWIELHHDGAWTCGCFYSSALRADTAGLQLIMPDQGDYSGRPDGNFAPQTAVLRARRVAVEPFVPFRRQADALAQDLRAALGEALALPAPGAAGQGGR